LRLNQLKHTERRDPPHTLLIGSYTRKATT